MSRFFQILMINLMMFSAGHAIAVGAFSSYGQCEVDCHLGVCNINGSDAYECDIIKK